MQTINGLYKAECIRTTVFHTGPYKTIADVEYATAAYTGPEETSRPSSTSKPITLPATESRTPYRNGRTGGASRQECRVASCMRFPVGRGASQPANRTSSRAR